MTSRMAKFLYVANVPLLGCLTIVVQCSHAKDVEPASCSSAEFGGGGHATKGGFEISVPPLGIDSFDVSLEGVPVEKVRGRWLK